MVVEFKDSFLESDNEGLEQGVVLVLLLAGCKTTVDAHGRREAVGRENKNNNKAKARGKIIFAVDGLLLDIRDR